MTGADKGGAGHELTRGGGTVADKSGSRRGASKRGDRTGADKSGVGQELTKGGGT